MDSVFVPEIAPHQEDWNAWQDAPKEGVDASTLAHGVGIGASVTAQAERATAKVLA